ncbi:hypothetical protein H5410_061212 [Solanum commersonii]|uniref:Uncharacterized protein n=1 Tax=Solanum commersonii TaxID=4109 RepID=A0A9J5W8Y4_SOLCO|nr:hypothetical protein H5410_061212 [Solanum commersonii]
MKRNSRHVAEKFCEASFWLARERGFKTNTTKSIAGGYWVVMGSARELERVNGLRRRLCLKAATQCSREIKLIRDKNRSLGTRPQSIWLGYITIVRS